MSTEPSRSNADGFDPIAVEAQMMGGDLVWGPYDEIPFDADQPIRGDVEPDEHYRPGEFEEGYE